jgi:carbon monoxide dehydrogenase subunit G
MASLRREIDIEVPAEVAWQALRDVAHAHHAFAGVLTDCRMEADDVRVVTFANGLVARERVVDVDDARRRVAYSVLGGRLTQHHATFDVEPRGPGASRVTWCADFQPDAMAPPIGALMDQGIAALKRNLER